MSRNFRRRRLQAFFESRSRAALMRSPPCCQSWLRSGSCRRAPRPCGACVHSTFFVSRRRVASGGKLPCLCLIRILDRGRCQAVTCRTLVWFPHCVSSVPPGDRCGCEPFCFFGVGPQEACHSGGIGGSGLEDFGREFFTPKSSGIDGLEEFGGEVSHLILCRPSTPYA